MTQNVDIFNLIKVGLVVVHNLSVVTEQVLPGTQLLLVENHYMMMMMME